VRAAILSTVQRVAQLPESGRAQKSPGIRKVVVSRYGYIIYYRVDESHGAVDIVTIRHPARRRLHQDR
jgi:plasmid stabilization system protein ParE